ncbi:ervatamin-B isoform X1 [Selaginella moellendorffii]|nr:ervatamin-B isoform X1 [Selaginella moellendorffii]|eukprot:XP_002977022.2 ervatamin-B isoform X1 [Selaginella moellendorffii]
MAYFSPLQLSFLLFFTMSLIWIQFNLQALSQEASFSNSVDWRESGAVSRVWDVDLRKSCKGGSWAFAAAGAVESLKAIQTGRMVVLSPQQLIDCNRYNSGCNEKGTADPYHAFNYIRLQGITTDSKYPYTGVQSSCKPFTNDVSMSQIGTVPGTSDSFLVEVVSKQPVIARIDGSASEFDSYAGGIYSGPCSDSKASLPVLIVGYGRTQHGVEYWILKNWWGRSWGEGGYMRLERGKCNILSDISFPRDPPKFSSI